MTWDFEQHKEEAIQLYLAKDQEAVQKHFRDRYNFTPKSRTWKGVWKKWGVSKYKPRELPNESTVTRFAKRKRATYENVDIAEASLDASRGVVVEAPPLDVATLLRAQEGPSKSTASGARQTTSNKRLCEMLSSVTDKYWRNEDYEKEQEQCNKLFDQASFVSAQESILHYIAKNSAERFRLPQVIDYMKTHGHPLTILDSKGRTALEGAIRADIGLEVYNLIEADPSLLEIQPAEDESLLHLAIRCGSRNACKKLISHYEDVNIKDSHGQTPLEAAVRYGFGDVVRKLLEFGATIDNSESALELIMDIIIFRDDLDIVAILEKGFLNTKSSEEVEHSCRKVLSMTVELLADLQLGWEEMSTHRCRVLEHILRRPSMTFGTSDLDREILSDFQRFTEHWSRYERDVPQVAKDCLRLFLQQGMEPCSGRRFPYTDCDVTEWPVVSYTYAKVCTETCDLSVHGQGLFDFLAFLFTAPLLDDPDEDPDEVEMPEEREDVWWIKEPAKLTELFQILLDRGLHLDNDVNLLSFVLLKVPWEHREHKLQLLKTLMWVYRYTPLDMCPKYGHPLHLLAQMASTSRWQVAEAMLKEEVLQGLLVTSKSPLQLELNAYCSDIFAKRLNVYTEWTGTLQRCILHVLTKRVMNGLSAMPSFYSNIQFREVMTIRREFRLPELQFSMDSRGVLKLLGNGSKGNEDDDHDDDDDDDNGES